MLAPPVKGFSPPSKSPFSLQRLQMSKNHTEIAGNQFWGVPHRGTIPSPSLSLYVPTFPPKSLN